MTKKASTKWLFLQDSAARTRALCVRKQEASRKKKNSALKKIPLEIAWEEGVRTHGGKRTRFLRGKGFPAARAVMGGPSEKFCSASRLLKMESDGRKKVRWRKKEDGGKQHSGPVRDWRETLRGLSAREGML